MLSLRFDELRFVPLSLDETDEQWERGKDDRFNLSLIHISEPTRLMCLSRMPSSA